MRLIDKFKKNVEENAETTTENRLISSTNNSDNLHQIIVQYFKIGPFDHLKHYRSFVSDSMANSLNPKRILISIGQNDVALKVTKWLYKNDFHSKNWIVEKRTSNNGIAGFLIYLAPKMQIQPVWIADREYNAFGTLIACKFFYDDYKFKNEDLRFFEMYKLENNQVIIYRDIYAVGDKGELSKNPVDYQIYNRENLPKEQILNINFLPIALVPNLPSDRTDLSEIENHIRLLDLILEEIIFDAILNSTRFAINSNGVYGNPKRIINSTILKFIQHRVLMMDYDPKTSSIPFSTINGEFRIDSLTKLYDWIVTNSNKRIGIHVPAVYKSAQQTVVEATGVNYETNNMAEQKIAFREETHAKLIALLLKFDGDLAGGKYFGASDIENLDIEVEIKMNKTLKKQFNDKEQDK